LDLGSSEAELQTIRVRRWGEATDITSVTIMLTSQAGTSIAGQIIPVDSGTSMVN
jgi:enoyl-[acyl-carrier-protein] reductase (NADH)